MRSNEGADLAMVALFLKKPVVESTSQNEAGCGKGKNKELIKRFGAGRNISLPRNHSGCQLTQAQQPKGDKVTIRTATQEEQSSILFRIQGA